MDYLRQQRIFKVFLLFLLLFIFNLGRIYYIQVSNHQKYASKMLAQDTMYVSLEDNPRGKIYDRNMVPLTDTVTKNKVIVFPAVIKEKKVTIKRLARILNLNDKEMTTAIGKKPHYLELKEDLTSAQVQEITKAELPGIRVAQVVLSENKQPLAAHTLGFLGEIYKEELATYKAKQLEYNPKDIVGRSGLEKLYETQLKGAPSDNVMRAYVDGNGQLISGLGYRIERNFNPNRHNLVLTIDKRVQQVVEKVMDSKVKKGSVVVMDPSTGDILAIAGRPVAVGDATNPPTQMYAPGSVFKIIVASAAIEEGKVTPNFNFFCAGDKDIIKCNAPSGHGSLTFSQAMAISCNPTFAKVGKSFLGAAKLIDYTRRFGLENQKITGYVAPPSLRPELNLISNNIIFSSIGQGTVLANPVQITGMTAIIANGGIYRQPRLVQQLTNSKGQVTKSYLVDRGKRVISPKTAAQVNEMLKEVVTTGTGKEAGIAQGSAGKTGTAEDGRGGTNAWFTGYAPFNNPKYVVTVFVESGKSGGKDAAPVFKDIMEELMKLP